MPYGNWEEATCFSSLTSNVAMSLMVIWLIMALLAWYQSFFSLRGNLQRVSEYVPVQEPSLYCHPLLI